jgi:cell division protein FtsB
LPIAYPAALTSGKLETSSKDQKPEATMPRQKTREELEDRIDELEAENETLQDQVDSIADIIEGEDDEDEVPEE